MQTDPAPLVPTHISKPLRDSQDEAAALENHSEQVSGQQAPPGGPWGPLARPKASADACVHVSGGLPRVRATQKGPVYLRRESRVWAAPWSMREEGDGRGVGG